MPRAREGAIFEFGGHWIAAEPGRRCLYDFWTDAGTGRTRRRSLGTTDLEDAKKKLAAEIIADAPKTADSLLSAVMLDYFIARTDKLPSKNQSRSAGRTLLKVWGNPIRVSELTLAKQKVFVEWCLGEGFGLSYAARVLTVVKSALNHANLNPPHRIVTAESKMHELWALQGKAKREAFIPSDDQMLTIAAAEMPERLRRWMIVMALTGCRPSAALDLSPAARRADAGLVDLNPAGRRQNKKHRPLVRETRVLRVFLRAWEKAGLDAYGGKYCGYTTYEGVKSAIEDLRADIGMPGLTAYSFRHKVGSVIRRARSGEDQVAQQLGHKRRDLRTTAGYGEFDPEYLAPAASALDAWALKLRRMLRQARNSHTTPAIVREQTRAAA